MSEEIDDGDDATCLPCRHCRGLVRHTKARRMGLRSVYRCDRCGRGCGKCDHCDFVTPSYQGTRFPSNCKRMLTKHEKECVSNMVAKVLVNEDGNFADNETESCFETGGEDDMNVNKVMEEAGVFEHVVDANEAMSVINDSLMGSQLMLDAMSLPNYGVISTDRYMRMEVKMFQDHGEVMGGYRSACWRSRYRTDCYGLDNMVNMDDAKFMFYVTSLFRNNSGAENSLMYRLLREIEQRHRINYVQPEITIPMTDREADRACLNGEFAIVDLMPKPKLHFIAGHPCYRINDVV